MARVLRDGRRRLRGGPRPVDRERGLPVASRRRSPRSSTTTLSWVLSAYSVVFGALLLGAGRIADRSGRRRWFLRGVAVFTLGSLLCGVATSAVDAHRRPGRAGRRRRAAHAGLARAAARRHRRRAAGPGGGHVGRHLRPRRGHRPVAGRGAHRRRRLALGLLHQPARPPRRRRGDAAGGHRVRGRRPAARPARRGAALAGGGVAGARHHAGRRLGLDEHRGARLLRRRRSCSACRPVRRARVHPAAAHRPHACSRTGRSPWPTPPPSPTPSASSPCSSPTCCSSPRCGTTPPSRPAWPSPRARWWWRR